MSITQVAPGIVLTIMEADPTFSNQLRGQGRQDVRSVRIRRECVQSVASWYWISVVGLHFTHLHYCPLKLTWLLRRV